MSQKLIPLLAEFIKNIGCKMIESDPESGFIIFEDKAGRHLELDTHPDGDSCYLVLSVLSRPYLDTDEHEIVCDSIIYESEIHEPNSLNRLKEVVNDRSETD